MTFIGRICPRAKVAWLQTMGIALNRASAGQQLQLGVLTDTVDALLELSSSSSARSHAGAHRVESDAARLQEWRNLGVAEKRWHGTLPSSVPSCLCHGLRANWGAGQNDMVRRWGRAHPGVYVARTMQCAAYYPQFLCDERYHPLGEVVAADDSPPLRALLEVWCRKDKRLWHRFDGSNQQELYPPEAVVISKVHLIAMKRCRPQEEEFRRVVPSPLRMPREAPEGPDGNEEEGPLTGRRRRAQDGSKKAKELARLQRRAAELLTPFEVELEGRAPPWQPPPGIPPRPSKRPRLE